MSDQNHICSIINVSNPCLGVSLENQQTNIDSSKNHQSKCSRVVSAVPVPSATTARGSRPLPSMLLGAALDPQVLLPAQGSILDEEEGSYTTLRLFKSCLSNLSHEDQDMIA